MQNDANGDGKLARSEVPPQFAERNFDRFDANSDGFIDRAEMESGAANFGGRRGGGGGGGGGGGRMTLDRAMHSVEDAFRALQESALNPSTLASDLAHIQTMQEGLIASKFHAATHVFPPEALAHFEGDEAAARLEFREHFIEALVMALEIEEAIMGGDADAVRGGLDALEEHEHHSHEEFRVD